MPATRIRSVHLVPAQRDEVLRFCAPLLFVTQGILQAAELCTRAGDVEQAILGDVGVDALRLGDGDHLVDRAAHGAHEVDDTLVSVGCGVCVAFACQLG